MNVHVKKVFISLHCCSEHIFWWWSVASGNAVLQGPVTYSVVEYNKHLKSTITQEVIKTAYEMMAVLWSVTLLLPELIAVKSWHIRIILWNLFVE